MLRKPHGPFPPIRDAETQRLLDLFHAGEFTPAFVKNAHPVAAPLWPPHPPHTPAADSPAARHAEALSAHALHASCGAVRIAFSLLHHTSIVEQHAAGTQQVVDAEHVAFTRLHAEACDGVSRVRRGIAGRLAALCGAEAEQRGCLAQEEGVFLAVAVRHASATLVACRSRAALRTLAASESAARSGIALSACVAFTAFAEEQQRWQAAAAIQRVLRGHLGRKRATLQRALWEEAQQAKRRQAHLEECLALLVQREEAWRQLVQRQEHAMQPYLQRCHPGSLRGVRARCTVRISSRAKSRCLDRHARAVASMFEEATREIRDTEAEEETVLNLMHCELSFRTATLSREMRARCALYDREDIAWTGRAIRPAQQLIRAAAARRRTARIRRKATALRIAEQWYDGRCRIEQEEAAARHTPTPGRPPTPPHATLAEVTHTVAGIFGTRPAVALRHDTARHLAHCEAAQRCTTASAESLARTRLLGAAHPPQAWGRATTSILQSAAACTIQVWWRGVPGRGSARFLRRFQRDQASALRALGRVRDEVVQSRVELMEAQVKDVLAVQAEARSRVCAGELRLRLAAQEEEAVLFRGILAAEAGQRRDLAEDASILSKALLLQHRRISRVLGAEREAELDRYGTAHKIGLFHLSETAQRAIAVIQRFWRCRKSCACGRGAMRAAIRRDLIVVRRERFERTCASLNSTLDELHAELHSLGVESQRLHGGTGVP